MFVTESAVGEIKARTHTCGACIGDILMFKIENGILSLVFKNVYHTDFTDFWIDVGTPSTYNNALLEHINLGVGIKAEVNYNVTLYH